MSKETPSETADLPKGKRDAKTRMCVVTREDRPLDELIRIALSPENKLVPDLKSRLPGRGAWVCANRKIVEQAVAKGAFARSFKTAIVDADELPQLISTLLRRDAIARISLAKKAGGLVSGAAKVERQLAGRETTVLLHAHDGAADGKRKLAGSLLSAFGEEAEKVKILTIFTTEELSLALGLENVIHAAIAGKRNGAGLISAVNRLEQYDAE